MTRTIAVFFVALCLYVTPYLWSPFASRGQAREAVVVMNMLEQHNFVLPLRNGAEIPSKPPLFHWSALPFVFANHSSISEFAMRIPSALSGALGIAIVFTLIQPSLGLVEAGLTAVVLATSLEWIRSANLARVDMVFCFCIVCAWLAFFRAFESRFRASGKFLAWNLAGGVFSGLAVLAKGPAALLFVGMFIVLYLVLLIRPWALKNPEKPDKQEKSETPDMIDKTEELQQIWSFRLLTSLAIAGVLSLLIALAWYLPAYKLGGERFLNVALLRENVGRIVDVEGVDPGHRKPFFYSLIYLLQDFLPWSLFLPFIGWRLVKQWDQFSGARKRILWAALIWLGLFFAAVTMSSSKRTVYLLPALPALAILFSAALFKMEERSSQQLLAGRERSGGPHDRYRGFALLTAVIGLIVAAGSIGLLFDPVREFALSHTPERYAESIGRVPQLLGESSIVGYGLVSAVFLLVSAAQSFYSGRLIRGITLLGFAWATVALTANYSVLPALERANSPRPFAEQMAQAIPAETPLYYYQDDFYSVIFYMRRNIPLLSDVAELPTSRPVYVLMRRQSVEPFLQAVPGGRLVIESQESAFYGKDKLALVGLGLSQLGLVEK